MKRNLNQAKRTTRAAEAAIGPRFSSALEKTAPILSILDSSKKVRFYSVLL